MIKLRVHSMESEVYTLNFEHKLNLTPFESSLIRVYFGLRLKKKTYAN